MTKKILITGGNGFIGTALRDKLLSKGYSVRILGRGTAKKSDNPNVEYVQANYKNINSLAQAMQGCQGVVHLAAAIFAYSFEEFEAANAGVTANLAQAAAQVEGLETFLYMSSQAAGGYSKDFNNPRTEDQAPDPISDYGKTKLSGERALEQHLPKEIKKIVFRPPIVYGKNDSGVSKIAAWVKRGIMVNTSKGDTYFSFVHVSDLVEAVSIAFELEQAAGQTFYICEEKSYTWKYFIRTMADAMGVKRVFMFTAPLWMLKITAWVYETAARWFKFVPALNYDKVKEAAIDGHWVCSSKKWVNLTGQKFTSLEEGLKKSF
ncbi:nucleoside-diphosphate-sugar epimerase [Elusimicrobium posterum]|uniref:NAD-dependent epimerase/dehydratase family protein n=1 Tax=Elusimicrobium posterum TaxID=3116653 RepID=UPI003C79267C